MIHRENHKWRATERGFSWNETTVDACPDIRDYCKRGSRIFFEISVALVQWIDFAALWRVVAVYTIKASMLLCERNRHRGVSHIAVGTRRSLSCGHSVWHASMI